MGKASDGAPGSQKVHDLLSANLAHLDLKGFIDERMTLQNRGATCDVYESYCSRHKKKVAVKCIRTVTAGRAEELDVKVNPCQNYACYCILTQHLTLLLYRDSGERFQSGKRWCMEIYYHFLVTTSTTSVISI